MKQAIFLFCITLWMIPQSVKCAESGARAYGNAPVGLNVLQLVYVHANAKGTRTINTDAGALYYYHYLNFLGKIAVVGGFIPYADASVSIPSAKLHFANRGMGDPTLVIGMDFFGAPALSRGELHHYHQKTIVGGSMLISMPLGQYDASSALNIGSNRWQFKPEIALSQVLGNFVVDLFGNYQFFTDNQNYHAGLVKEQEGVWGIESHLSYTLMPRAWVSVDYFRTWGGETIINGIHQRNRIREGMIGATFNFALSSRFSIQSKYRHVTISQSGSKTRSFGLKLQYLW